MTGKDAAPARERGAVTMLDVVKALAVLTMVADHVGLYFLTDQPWWRVAGRPTIVVFGFLIGLAGPRAIPPRWILFGLFLTLLEGWTDSGGDDSALDTLVGLALARAVLPAFESAALRSPWLLAPAAVLCGLVAEPVNALLEYGTEIWMFMLAGLAARLARRDAAAFAPALAAALCAGAAYLIISHRHFGFDMAQTAIAGMLIAATLAVLLAVPMRPLSRQPSTTLAGPLRFLGTHTLEIYAAHLALFMIANWWLDID